MSSLYWNNGTPLTFKDYISSESIRPKKIEYGTNAEMNNSAIVRDQLGWHTFFYKDNHTYFIFMMDNGEVGLAAYEGKSTEYDGKFTDRRTNRGDAIALFSHVIYVILQIADYAKVSSVKFRESDPSLGSVYSIMVRNNSLISDIQSHGYEYSGKIEGYFTFDKIEH